MRRRPPVRRYLGIRPACEVCGLDFAFTDAGDGPAVFIILGVGFLVVGLALVVEVVWSPPYWLHALIWAPLIIGLSLGLLRPLKGLFIGIQYRQKAREGRLSSE